MKIPKYCHHKGTGQAYVKLGGKFVYLGAWGSKKSRQKYETTIGEYLSRGRQSPAKVPLGKPGVAVGTLYAIYLEHCREYYQRNGKPTGEYQSHVYLRTKIETIWTQRPALPYNF